MGVSNYIIPMIIFFIFFYGAIKKVDIFQEFLSGAEEGIKTSFKILPALICLLVTIGMFKASGAVDILTTWLTPVVAIFSFPAQCISLILLRPVSGSGAIAIFQGILAENGADSVAGMVASVMLGSTETTFYTIAVYFSAVKVKYTRHTLPAALSGDLIGWIASGIIVKLILS